jgi:hypothetical protein
MSTRRFVWLVTASVTLACLLPMAAAGLAAGATQSASRRSASSAGSGLPLLDVVMLVDESGSETPVSVAQERQVSATIGQSMLNPGSRITVVGFGGVNNVVPHQDPVNVACNPTVVDSQRNLDYLSTCVNGLKRRTEREGDDTDYAAALGQAMTYFNPASPYGAQSPPGAIKVILMMTDGGVDVHRDTQQYGQNWLQGETQAVNEQLAKARQYHAQLWTLGMGTDITSANEAYLRHLAASGAPSPCGETPRSTLVTNRSNALAALTQLYADASCHMGISHASPQPLPSGGHAQLQVSIPAFATDAAIAVDRGDPGVQVSFYQPGGALWTQSSAISGQAGDVEVLHVTNPRAGTWTMKLTAPPGLKSELVSATAFYQGAVRAVITASPPSARPGQQISVTLSVLGAKGPITNATEVKSLLVGVVVSGDGLAKPVPVTVSNAGENNSADTGVANYTGAFQAPKAAGTLTFSGTAEGYGLYATEVPASVQVGATGTQFQATVQFAASTSVQRGSSIQGQIILANTTGATRKIRVALGHVSNAVVRLTRPAGPIAVTSGHPQPVPFTIYFAKDSPVGSAWLTIKVSDVANSGTVYADGPPLNITVTRPPGFIAKYLWVIVGIIALIALIIAVALLTRARRRHTKDVRPLRVQVSHDGSAWSAEHRPLGKWTDTFVFVVRDEDNANARPEQPDPDNPSPVYTARRSGRGQVRLWTPDRQERDVTLGSSGAVLDNGLRVSFRDIRRRAVLVPPGIGATPPPAPSLQPAPLPPNGQATSVPPEPPEPTTPSVQVPPEQAGGWDDPWLN